MDAFEKWYLDNYDHSSGPVSLVVKTTCEEAFRAGMRAAAEIAQAETDRMLACQIKQKGMRDEDMAESINTNIRMMASAATAVKDAIIAEADK